MLLVGWFCCFFSGVGLLVVWGGGEGFFVCWVFLGESGLRHLELCCKFCNSTGARKTHS